MSKSKISRWETFETRIGLQNLIGSRAMLSQIRFVFVIYFFLILLYYFLFSILQDWTLKCLTTHLGPGFGPSFSASLLEDLAIFPFLSLVITVVSLQISTKKPGEYEFDSRVKAIMNSKKVQFNEQVFKFLVKEISVLLAYNTLVDVEVDIEEYDQKENIYTYVYERTQLMTNMCSDQDFKSPSSQVEIYTDKEIKKSFGKIHTLNCVDAANFNNVIEPIIKIPAHGRELDEGKNVFDMKYTIPRDAEYAVKLSYHVFSEVKELKTGEKVDSDEGWSYIAVSKYTSKMHFKLINSLKESKFKLSVRRRNSDGKISYNIKENVELHYGESYSHVEDTPMMDDDRIEFYITKPYS